MGRKPKPPLSEWLVAQRKAHGESVEDVGRLLDRSPATIRGWEAGRPPTVEDGSIVVLERHYGSAAPKETPPPDFGELVTELREQTAAINRLADAMAASSTGTLLRALADVQADQSAHVQENSERILTLERAIGILLERGVPASPGRPAPRETGE